MTLTTDKAVTTSTQIEEGLDNAILKLERESLIKSATIALGLEYEISLSFALVRIHPG